PKPRSPLLHLRQTRHRPPSRNQPPDLGPQRALPPPLRFPQLRISGAGRPTCLATNLRSGRIASEERRDEGYFLWLGIFPAKFSSNSRSLSLIFDRDRQSLS